MTRPTAVSKGSSEREGVTTTTTTEQRHQRKNGRVPPHSPDAEAALVGALLLAPRHYPDVAALVSAGDFYLPAHGAVFAAIARLVAEERHIDALTVRDAIGEEATVSLADLLSLESRTPMTSGAVGYAEIIAEHAQQRRALALGAELQEAAYEGDTATALRLISEAPNRVGQPTGHRALDWEPLGDAVRGTEQENAPELLYRSDNHALLYPGRLHWFQAEPGRAKSWVALLCVIEQLTFGEHVLYLDYESNRRDVGKRLRKLGAEAEVAEEFLHYARPGPHTPALVSQLAADIERWRPALCVLDGVAKSLVRNGYKEKDNDEVGAWIEAVCSPITAQGVALVAIDHVTKDPESRGRYARGAGVKLAAVDGAAYSMKRIKALSHNQAGEYHLIVEKDKEGGVAPEGDIAAVLRMEEDERTHLISFSLQPPGELDRLPRGVQTVRHRVVEYLTERAGEEFSITHMEGVVQGSVQQIRQALVALADTGEITCRSGPRRAQLYSVGATQQEEF